MAYDAEFSRHLTVDPLSITEPRERLAYLRDFLRALPPSRFNMSYFSHAPADDEHDLRATRIRSDCGTTACIAGWAVALFTYSDVADGMGVASTLLGLPIDVAEPLFYAGMDLDTDRGGEWDATPAQAADVLTHLLATGEVDWAVAKPRPSEAATTVQPIREKLK